MARLLDKYKKEIVPALAQEVRPQERAEPAEAHEDRREHGRRQGAAGQEPDGAGGRAARRRSPARSRQITKAQMAVSGFRLREGNEIGCRVTLRGKRMYEFLDRLINVALPRIRDFRGVNPKSFDGNGNYTPGPDRAAGLPRDRPGQGELHPGHGHHVRDHAPRNDDEARELLRAFGMPFRESMKSVIRLVPSHDTTANSRPNATERCQRTPKKPSSSGS